MSGWRENLTSSSEGEGLETGRCWWPVPRQSFTRQCHFRDTQGERLGRGLESTRTTTPERRDRLLLLSAIAIALMTLLGRAGESLGYNRLLRANTVRRRTHSLFRPGMMLYELIPTLPEARLCPLMQRFGAILLEHQAMRAVFGYICNEGMLEHRATSASAA